MSELKATDLREKIAKDLDLAREKVRMLEEQLNWIDDAINSAIHKDIKPATANPIKFVQQSLLAEPPSSPGSALGDAIRELMINATEKFNVPGIVNAVKNGFPDMEYSEISKRGSQVATRLCKQGKIILVEKGVGRSPNTYESAKNKKSQEEIDFEASQEYNKNDDDIPL